MSNLTPVSSHFAPSEKDFKGDSSHVEDIARLEGVKEEEDAEVARYTDASVVIDDATNARLLRLLNRRVLPIMVATYFFQTLDKGTLAFSSILGLREDNNLVGQQYSWLGTILYMGYLVGEFPMVYAIQRLPLAKFLACIVFTWGVCVACHAATTNWAGLMVVRILLGLFESAVQPCLMALTTMYYRREEHTWVVSIWFAMQGLQLMFSGLISFGIAHVTSGPLAAWQVLFVLVSALTVIHSGIILVFLPDSIMSAKCWSEEDKVLLVERLRSNELGVQNRKFKWEQAREAMTDPAVWIMLLMQFAIFLPVSGLAVFANIIVKGLGFSVLQAQLLNLAQGAISLLIYFSSAYVANKSNQTIFVMILWLIPAVAGTVVLAAVEVTPKNAPGMLIAFYAVQFVISTGNLLWSLLTRNIAGRSKVSAVNGAAFLAYAAGCITGPQLFQAGDSPRYIPAWIAHLCIYGFYIALAILLRIILMRRNAAKRRATQAAAGDVSEDATGRSAEKIDHSRGFDDLTDLANPSFRYSY